MPLPGLPGAGIAGPGGFNLPIPGAAGPGELGLALGLTPVKRKKSDAAGGGGGGGGGGAGGSGKKLKGLVGTDGLALVAVGGDGGALAAGAYTGPHFRST